MSEKHNEQGDKLRILMAASPITAGPRSLYTLELARGLVEQGHDVLVITPRLGMQVARRYQWIPLRSEPALASPILRSFRLGSLFREIKNWNPDLLHVQSIRALPIGSRISSHLDIPAVVSAHSSGESPRFLRTLRALVEQGGQVIASSEAVRQDLVNRGRVTKESIHVIPVGVPDRSSGPPVSWIDQQNRRVPVVATIGDLEPEGGFHFFLEAARLVHERALVNG